MPTPSLEPAARNHGDSRPPKLGEPGSVRAPHRCGRPRTETPRPAIEADSEHHITTLQIQLAVSARYGLHPKAMLSPQRSFVLSHPRQVAIYLSTRLTKLSLVQIGRKFGGRHHTTIISSVRAVQQRIRAGEADVRRAVAELERELLGEGG